MGKLIMMKTKTLLLVLFLTGLTSSAQNVFRTACRGDLDRLDSLLQHNPINTLDTRGRSLLHWAVGCQQKEVFNFLIKKGLAPNLEDNQKRTPLHVAVSVGNQHYFETLVKLSADSTWIDKYGTALLESAILNRSFLFVQKLINAGVAVNESNERGSTPLEIANRLKANEIYKLLVAAGADEKAIRKFEIKGAYMGQAPPGASPKMFAPNFISTEESEFGSVFNKNATEFYYGVDVNGRNEIRFSQLMGDKWSNPKIILADSLYGYNDPFLSNDEQRLYFISNRAMDGKGSPKDIDIWYVERENNGWSAPLNAGANINTKEDEYYISFTQEGSMYFASNGHKPNKTDHDIYFSKEQGGNFQKPVALGDSINTDAYEADVYVAPDESYIIFCSTRENGIGQGDLYISFKDADNHWSKAINMGERINTKNYEYCPFVTSDGKYLFYTSNQDIYWVSTTVIEELRKAALIYGRN